jgi:hypothetical protein
MATHKSSDLSAALTGLILGGVVLFLLLTGIVLLTNRKYAGQKSEAAPATQSQ